MQTRRYFAGGDTGRGKSTLVAALVRHMRAAGRMGRLVILTTDPPHDLAGNPSALLHLTDHVVTITDRTQHVDWATALGRSPRLYVEIAATNYPRGILGDLGDELYQRGAATLVADEAHATLPTDADPRLVRLWGEGRKRGIDCIALSASIMNRKGLAVHGTVFDHSDVRIMFRAASSKVADKLADDTPKLAALLPQLKGPENGGPQYIVYRKGNPYAELVSPTGKPRVIHL